MKVICAAAWNEIIAPKFLWNFLRKLLKVVSLIPVGDRLMYLPCHWWPGTVTDDSPGPSVMAGGGHLAHLPPQLHSQHWSQTRRQRCGGVSEDWRLRLRRWPSPTARWCQCIGQQLTSISNHLLSCLYYILCPLCERILNHCTIGEIGGHTDIVILSNLLSNISFFEPLLVFINT